MTSAANPHPADRALAFLRVVVAALLAIHGMARIGLGIVDDFGAFLDGTGVPMGIGLAWATTLFEIGGGALLALGVGVRVVALLFCAELALGIALVHWPAGWFVVGAGRNGMEYSVLLIAVLGALAWAPPGRDDGREVGDDAGGSTGMPGSG